MKLPTSVFPMQYIVFSESYTSVMFLCPIICCPQRIHAIMVYHLVRKLLAPVFNFMLSTMYTCYYGISFIYNVVPDSS